MKRDGYIGFILIVLSILLYSQSTKIQHSPLVPISSAFYPRIVLILLLIAGLFLMISDISKTFKGGKTGRGNKLSEKSLLFKKYKFVFGSFIIVGLYILSISFLGFYFSTTGFLICLQWYLSARIMMRLPKYLLISIMTTLLIYIVFEKYLHIFFPRGYLF